MTLVFLDVHIPYQGKPITWWLGHSWIWIPTGWDTPDMQGVSYFLANTITKVTAKRWAQKQYHHQQHLCVKLNIIGAWDRNASSMLTGIWILPLYPIWRTTKCGVELGVWSISLDCFLVCSEVHKKVLRELINGTWLTDVTITKKSYNKLEPIHPTTYQARPFTMLPIPLRNTCTI